MEWGWASCLFVYNITLVDPCVVHHKSRVNYSQFFSEGLYGVQDSFFLSPHGVMSHTANNKPINAMRLKKDLVSVIVVFVVEKRKMR